MKLTGRTAVVTGCGPNIGAAIALALAGEGAGIACVDAEALFADKCAEDVRTAGGRAEPFVCDVRDEGQVRATVDRVVERMGGVDVLLNGVAVRIGKGLLDTSLEEFRLQMDVILTGTFLDPPRPARQHHQSHFYGGAPGVPRQHRLRHGQERSAELHSFRGHGTGRARNQSE